MPKISQVGNDTKERGSTTLTKASPGDEHGSDSAGESAEQDQATIPVVEEQLAILKRKKLTKGVRVHTVVHEEEEAVDEPLATEEIDIERVPLDRWVEGPVPVRQEGETTILTLLEEVVVVEKRLRAVEEVRITRRQTVRHDPQTVTLRREEAVIEDLDAADSEQDPD